MIFVLFFLSIFYSFHCRFRSEIETLETLRDSLQMEVDNSADLLKQKDRDLKAKDLQVHTVVRHEPKMTVQ